MNTPITITPHELIGMIIAICAAVVTISTAVSVIIKAFSKVKEPENHQNARLDAIEKRLDEVDRELAIDKKRIGDIEYGHGVTQEALLALLNYSLNNEEVEGLRVAKRKLEGYLISKGELHPLAE